MKRQGGVLDRYVFNSNQPYLIVDSDGESLMSTEVMDLYIRHMDAALNTTRDVAQVRLDVGEHRGKAISSFRNLINHQAKIIKMGMQNAFLAPEEYGDGVGTVDAALAAAVKALQDIGSDSDDGAGALEEEDRRALSPLGHGVYCLAQFDLLFGELRDRLVWLFKHVLDDHAAEESVGVLLDDEVSRSRKAIREYLRSKGVPV